MPQNETTSFALRITVTINKCLRELQIKEALERAELSAKRSTINLGMVEKIDDLHDPPIANNFTSYSCRRCFGK